MRRGVREPEHELFEALQKKGREPGGGFAADFTLTNATKPTTKRNIRCGAEQIAAQNAAAAFKVCSADDTGATRR